MRYLVVAYDESNLPSPTYDLFTTVGEFLAGEGLDEAGIADLHAPSAVQEMIAEGGSPARRALLQIRRHAEIAQEELGGVTIPNDRDQEGRFEAVQDELASIVTLVDAILAGGVESEHAEA